MGYRRGKVRQTVGDATAFHYVEERIEYATGELLESIRFLPWGDTMAYLTDISKVLGDQLTKFATLNRHQLAGQVANLDFWCDELRHCLEVLDGYKPRFERMKAAQARYATEHETIEFALDDPCCIRGPVPPPRRIDYREINQTRQSICEAMYRFLVRCHNESLIDEAMFQKTVDEFGITIEAKDLKG